MATKIDWAGDQWAAKLGAEMKRRTSAAAKRLEARIKAEIRQEGTLRYNPIGKRGQALKTQRTVYNFSHSRPGNPPFKQSGHLGRTIMWELVAAGSAWIGRVGTNLKYGRYLELGTSRMKARPFLRSTLRKFSGELTAILTAKIAPGGLGQITSNQFRAGHLGAGARKAGF